MKLLGKSWILRCLIVASFLKTSSGFLFEEDAFSSFKDSLKNAQEYLSNELLPLIAKGLKAAQKVEEFVDASIGEDCQFLCSNKNHPIPKKGHKPTSNGCGSMDVYFNDSEDSLIQVEQEFTECCDSHDFCYDTCNNDKDECDLKFKKCLYKVCKTKKKAFLDSKTCQLKAKMFYLAVIGVGCQSYLNAQGDACDCQNSNSQKTEL